MKLLKTKEEISVALLIDDLVLAKKWASIFRIAGVVPHIYQTLEDFWQGILNQTPALALVDIKRLAGDKKLQLKNHPMVQTKEIALSFYWTPETAPLLHLSYEIVNLGLVSSEASLEGQIKSVLQRFNAIAKMREKSSQSQESGSLADKKLHQLVRATEELKEKDFYQSLLKSITGRFETHRDAIDFEHACASVFSTLFEIKQFSILELSQNGQKLISPRLSISKFMSIPSLWLGRTCNEGIEFFAQNMASQTCLELMGGELMSLLIKGRKKYPDKILFVRVPDEEFLNRFDWESLERYLSGFHSHFQMKNLYVESNDHKVMEPWQLLSFIDEIQYGKLPESEVGGTDSDWAVINLNFSELIETIRSKKGQIRFYWQLFFRDFFQRFEAKKDYDFKVACFGVENVALLVAKDQVDKILHDLNAHANRYPFWKFFEDVDIVLAKNFKPTAHMIPFSVEAYLRYLDEGDYMGEREASHTTPKMSPEAQNFWGTAPRETM